MATSENYLRIFSSIMKNKTFNFYSRVKSRETLRTENNLFFTFFVESFPHTQFLIQRNIYETKAKYVLFCLIYYGLYINPRRTSMDSEQFVLLFQLSKKHLKNSLKSFGKPHILKPLYNVKCSLFSFTTSSESFQIFENICPRSSYILPLKSVLHLQ